LVSFKKNIIAKISITDAIVISQNGAFTQKGKSIAQIAGPTIKPSQNKAQISHIFVILSFLSFEISDNIELIILIFQPVIQFIILAIINTEKTLVNVISKFEKNDQIIHKSNIFFLPKTSDNCPKIGPDKNEKKAYATIA
jgi:hypothetical protein